MLSGSLPMGHSKQRLHGQKLKNVNNTCWRNVAESM